MSPHLVGGDSPQGVDLIVEVIPRSPAVRARGERSPPQMKGITGSR